MSKLKIYQYVLSKIKEWVPDRLTKFYPRTLEDVIGVYKERTLRNYLAAMAQLGLLRRFGRRGGYALA